MTQQQLLEAIAIRAAANQAALVRRQISRKVISSTLEKTQTSK
jgi:hypothetical protein